jgi:hypothetical protein
MAVAESPISMHDPELPKQCAFFTPEDVRYLRMAGSGH